MNTHAVCKYAVLLILCPGLAGSADVSRETIPITQSSYVAAGGMTPDGKWTPIQVDAHGYVVPSSCFSKMQAVMRALDRKMVFRSSSSLNKYIGTVEMTKAEHEVLVQALTECVDGGERPQ